MKENGRQCLPLKTSVIYGPVHSRRLGESLGINLSPTGRKICSFNSVYCHYGWSAVVVHNSSQYENEFADPDEVYRSLEEFLKENQPPDYITFSGNGEPTTHPQFDNIVSEVVKIRDRLVPDIKITILSNSTTSGNPRISDALRKLDLRFMKLDCGDERTFLRFNRPAAGITLSGIINDLASMNMPIVVQTLMADGAGGNFNDRNLICYIEAISRIKPESVQLYSLDRPTPDGSLRSLSKEQLGSIAEIIVAETEVEIEIFGRRPQIAES